MKNSMSSGCAAMAKAIGTDVLELKTGGREWKIYLAERSCQALMHFDIATADTVAVVVKLNIGMIGQQ